MTYTSNTTKEGFVTNISAGYFKISTGRSWVKIYATPTEIQQIKALQPNTKIRCKVEQLRDSETQKNILTTLISYTVKSDNPLSESFKEFGDMLHPYIDDIQKNINDKD